jgi:hypothetical protein
MGKSKRILKAGKASIIVNEKIGDEKFMRIDFGDVGLKIGDTINFVEKPEIIFIVGSGDGTPGNGGSLIRYKNRKKIGSYSIRYMTKKLLKLENLPEDIDVWEYWTHRGKTLRQIYNERVNKDEFKL